MKGNTSEYVNAVIVRLQEQDYTESEIIQELARFQILDENVLTEHFEPRGRLHTQHEYAAN